MTVEVVRASPAHVGTIAARMREADVIECRAMGHTPKEALRLGLTCSTLCYTAKIDGRAEAMFGIVVTNALCGSATPWMLGTEAIYRHPREMLGWGPLFLARLADSSTTLSNVVGAGNARAIRFLRRLGFTIGEEVILTAGVEFLPFSMDLR